MEQYIVNVIKMTSILVTGGAGFIGSNLIAALLESGYKVVCVDDLSTGHEKNIKEFESNQNFIFKNIDIRNYKLLEAIIKENKIELISHQAARGSVPKSIQEPLVTNDVNVNGTLNVLWAAHKNNVKRVVVAISSSVYGDSEVLPKREDMPYNPKSPYAVSKVAKELYLKVFNQLYSLETVGLRYFNVYGPKQDPNGAYAAVIPKLISNALNNEPLSINGDGEQTRDFTYITDVVKANLLALKENAANGKSFNIAVGKSTTVNELAENIIEVTGSKSKIVHGQDRPGDVKHSIADISLAKKYLNFSPSIEIGEGLRFTIDWFRRTL